MSSSVEGRNVVLTYGDHVALESSTFSFPAAGVTALIGPNGSGKSTLLAAVAGLHPVQGGVLAVLGDEPAEIARRVAYVPQSTKVNDALPVTVAEVVAMGRYASLGLRGRFRDPDRRAVSNAIDRLGLAGLADRHIRELSGGQRQRTFVAQGLVQDRRLLLLDEPTVALDLVSVDTIHAVIAEEREAGRPVVVTTHDLSEAHGADHVVLLAGRVVAAGKPEAVLTQQNLSEAYGLAGDFHLDDAAHRPTGKRHSHVEPKRRSR